MESKKSQITIFVILAIIIVIVIIVLFIFLRNNSDINENSNLDLGAQARTDVSVASILGCMKDICSDSIEMIGIQGGYNFPPNNSYILNGTVIPYFYLDNTLLIPSDRIIESELGKYVDSNLNYCINLTKSSDTTLIYNKPHTTVKIFNNHINFIINMPVTIKKDDKTNLIELSKSPININSKLFGMLEIAKYITNSNKKNDSSLCISCIGRMALDRNLSVDIISSQKNISNLVIISHNLSKDIHPHIFEFLIKY